jgi:hypothetical protein
MLKLENFWANFVDLDFWNWTPIVTDFILTSKFVYNQKFVLNQKVFTIYDHVYIVNEGQRCCFFWSFSHN